jgi:hypothetical protein
MKSYIRAKKSLLREMCIKLTNTEDEYLNSLQTEIQVDNYVRQLILKKL